MDGDRRSLSCRARADENPDGSNSSSKRAAEAICEAPGNRDCNGLSNPCAKPCNREPEPNVISEGDRNGGNCIAYTGAKPCDEQPNSGSFSEGNADRGACFACRDCYSTH